MSDAERGAYEASGAGGGSAPTATISSLKSEDSTEQLISNTAQNNSTEMKEVKELSVTSKSVEAGSEERPRRRRLVVFLGLAQVVLGALLVSAGALAVVKGAALSRVGAGLWAGCVSVVAGVVGVLAGINDCYGLYGAGSGSPLLTAFMALSLLCLACGNSAAVLAATGLQRDSLRDRPTEHASFEDERQAWTPVMTNIALLLTATLHCLVCLLSIYHLSKRVCPCFSKKPPFDHNQFEPALKAAPPYVIHLDEKPAPAPGAERARRHHLCQQLEVRLQGDKSAKKKDEVGEFDSANSKEKLVTRWLGRHHSVAEAAAMALAGAGARGERTERPERTERRGAGVRKPRARPPPVVLLPAHPASTLGRLPACVVVPPRYATLPLPHPAPLYYPVHDTMLQRARRRRSPRAHGERRRREHARERERERDSQLARSLERIHRKRRDRITDADLKRTYTGLDRAYAEQFIAAIDESRHAAELHDSLPTTATSHSDNSTHHDL